MGNPPLATHSYMEKCPQGLSGIVGEDERPKQITGTGLTVITNTEMPWICVCQRGFKTERSMKIHRTKKGCEVVLENRSVDHSAHKTDGTLPQVGNHSEQTTNSQTPTEHHGSGCEKQRLNGQR